MGEFFGIVSGIIGVIGYIPYIKDTLRGTTRPDTIAWLIWSLEYTALFFAQLSAGATASLRLIGLQLLGVVVTFFFSLRFGKVALSRFTASLLIGVFVALVVWYSTKSAALAIFILIAVEASGVALTVAKTYRAPKSETLSFWILVSVAGALGIPAVGLQAAPILFVYPCSLVVMSLSVIGASLLGARKQRHISIPKTEPSSP